MAKETEDAGIPRVYEVGVHFVASITAEKAIEKFESLKAFIGKQGGEIVSEEAPELIDLAYTMVKHVAGKNQKFNTAHFSWVKFEIDADKVAGVKESLDGDTEVLRYIIVKTVKENTLHGHKFGAEAQPKKESRKTEKEAEKPLVAEGEVKAEMDKAIDELVTE